LLENVGMSVGVNLPRGTKLCVAFGAGAPLAPPLGAGFGVPEDVDAGPAAAEPAAVSFGLMDCRAFGVVVAVLVDRAPLGELTEQAPSANAMTRAPSVSHLAVAGRETKTAALTLAPGRCATFPPSQRAQVCGRLR
jgi:hypothetical protein